jgi:hypothetical protein
VSGLPPLPLTKAGGGPHPSPLPSPPPSGTKLQGRGPLARDPPTCSQASAWLPFPKQTPPPTSLMERGGESGGYDLVLSRVLLPRRVRRRQPGQGVQLRDHMVLGMLSLPPYPPRQKGGPGEGGSVLKTWPTQSLGSWTCGLHTRTRGGGGVGETLLPPPLVWTALASSPRSPMP